MELVTAVVPLVLEYSFAPIARHVSYPFNYKRKVTSLEKEVKELEEARDRWVELTDNNRNELSQDVLDWLKDVNEFIGKEVAELNLANEETKKKCCFGFCPNLKRRYHVSKKAERLAEVAAGFSAKNGAFSPTDDHVHPRPLHFNERFPSKGFEAFASRTSILKDIMQALTRVEVNTVGVYGTGGVGKTTLAKEVARKAGEEKLFDEVIMVTVTTDVDVVKIRNRIVDILKLDIKEKTEDERAVRLCHILKNEERKILIILDDLWKKLKLEEVGIPQPGEHNGCKLLLTSRNSNVLSNEMGSQKVFPINALAADEAWGLFQKMADSSFDDPVAKDVAKVCAGLPIAIVTVASSLKGKDTFEWRNALTTLKTTPPADLPEMLTEVYWPIQLSYSKLDTEELRSTFLLCCQLGYNSTIRDLLKYCIGLDLLDVDKVEDAQCRVYSLVRELKRRCLLLEGRQLVMHDLVRDVGRWIAYHRHGVVVVAADRNNRKDWADEEKIKTYKRIWLYNNAVKLQEELQCPDLVFLHIDGNYGDQLPDKLFKGLDKLKVLSFTGFNFSFLPSSVGLLKNLTTLSFYQSSQVGEDVRIVGELKKLEVLSFADSIITHLPKEIGQLTKLKLLDLSDCGALGVIPSNVLSKLSRLEELYMVGSFNRWGVEGGANASLTELKQLHFLSNLEIEIPDANLIPEGLLSERLCRYRIFIGARSSLWRKEDMVKTLKMRIHADTNMSNGVSELLKETQGLYLEGVENILCDSPLSGMQSFGKLRRVEVKNCNKLTHLFSFTVAQGLSQLQEIIVRDCESMEEIVSEENKLANTGKREATTMEEIVFPQLLKLELFDLPKLKRFCKGYLLKCPLLKELHIKRLTKQLRLDLVGLPQGLSQLQEIIVTDCESMEEIVSEENKLANTGKREATTMEKIVFPQLLKLELVGLPKLKRFCKGGYLLKCPLLKKLEIRSCRDLKTFISRDQNEDMRLEGTPPPALFDDRVCFPSLVEMDLEGLDNMESIWDNQLASGSFGEENTLKREATTMEEIVFPQLLKLELVGLPKLKIFCKGYLLKCPLLKELRIARCRHLKTFISREHENMRLAGTPPALFDDRVTFPTLVEMRLNDLDSMESIWDNQLAFGELRELTIWSCEKLQKVFPSAQHGRFQKLEKLEVWNCTLLEEIFEDEEGGSNNHAISFQLRVLELESLPKLKNVFPYSIATHLQKLERIKILKSGVEEIVAAAKAEMNGETIVCFEFPELTSLTFKSVPTLRRWYPGMHTLRLPKLKDLEITIDIQMPLLFPREVICNLQELELSGGRNSESKPWHEDFPANLFSTLKLLELSGFGNLEGIPVSILQEFHNLEKLSVEDCAFEELFSFDGSVTAEVVERLLPRLKHLQLRSLEDMRYLCGGQQNHTFDLSPLFRTLETLKVKYCYSLVSVVRPSSTTMSFPNLTSLTLSHCFELVNIVTTTTAKSLSNLVTLVVESCSMVTEIVEGEDDGDDEITFTKLQKLTLKDLWSLTSFCSGNYGFIFPCLKEVTVEECPRMKLFSPAGQLLNTPKLSNVYIGASWERMQVRWEGNLNATIRQLHIEMVRSLKLSEFHELREIWHGGQLPVKSFSKLEELEVDGCSNFSTAIPFNLMPYLNKLWTLSVSECDSLEGLFDWEKLLLNPDAPQVALLPELCQLFLRDLPRLHHIFPSHPPPIFDLKKLGSLKLRNCSSLKNVLTTSMALCLVSLTTIEIINCIALEEIITQEENARGLVAKVIFPRLQILVLKSLPNLISFNSGSGILDFSSLEQIIVYNCPKMKPFMSSFLRGQLSKVVVDEIQPVATTSLVDDDDKVAYPKLTTMGMDWNDAMEEIGHGQFQAKFFSQLHTLAITNLPHHHLTFPSQFQAKFFSQLHTLAIINAMFEEITIHEKDTSVGSLEKLRNLTLSNLPRLVHLAREGSPLCSIFQNLEMLEVCECGRLGILVPSTISFQSLTTLHVSECHKLLHLMTCTSAKSLVLLTRMIISECQMLEQIVGSEENLAESEVTLTKLECLELHCLPSLLGFSLLNCAFTFPSLKDVVVRECPKMEIFSHGVVTAPKVRRVIQTAGKEKWCWKGSLNATIQKLYEDQTMLPKRSNLDVDAGQLVRNGKSHMSDGTSSEGFCEIKNPSVTKDDSPDTTTTKHNEDDEEDPSSSTPMDIGSISQAQMDDFSTDQNKTIPPSSTEQSVHGDATDTPSSHNQQGVSSLDKESLHKSDPAPRPRDEEQVSKQDEQLRKQEEQLRTQEERLKKQEEQLRAQEERLRTQKEQTDLLKKLLDEQKTTNPLPEPPPTA